MTEIGKPEAHHRPLGKESCVSEIGPSRSGLGVEIETIWRNERNSHESDEGIKIMIYKVSSFLALLLDPSSSGFVMDPDTNVWVDSCMKLP